MAARRLFFCLAFLAATIARAADSTNTPAVAASTNTIGSLGWVKETFSREGPDPVVALALKYFSGDGVPQDGKKAVSLFAIAAIAGDARAEYCLGAAFEQGNGVPKNDAKANDWFKAAALDGNAAAFARLAAKLWNTATNNAEKIKAAQLMRRPANAGYAPAQADLGIDYQVGPESMRDLVEALKWLQLAVDNDFPDAIARRDEVASLLSPAQKAEAMRRVKAFKPRRSDEPLVLDEFLPITVPLLEYFRISIRAFRGNRTVLLDTGTSYAAFGTRFKRGLGPSMSLVNIETTSSSSNTWEQYDCPAISIGGQRFAPLLAVMMDIGKFQRAIGEPLAGVIGMSCLKNSMVCFDSDNGRLTIGGDVPASLKQKGVAVPMLQKERRSYGINAFINGRGPIFLALDTGDNAALDLNEGDFKTVFGEKSPAARENLSMSMEGKAERTRSFRIKLLTIGRLKCANIIAGTQINSDSPSRLGQQFFRRYLCAMDFPNNTLYLQPGKNAKVPFNYDMSGLGLQKNGNVVSVLAVDEDSPAYAAGVRLKDQIISLNGQDVPPLTLSDLRIALSKKPGEELHLKIKRGQETRSIQFKLKKML